MRLCKRLETQMSLGFWLEHWGLVCQLSIAAHITLLTGPIFSILSSADFADTENFGPGSEKELHYQCRETHSIETCELS